MAKKIKIDVDFTEDNRLIGISCHKKDYWFAYHLNDRLKMKLKRLADFPFYHPKLDEILNYSLFHDCHQDNQMGYFLIANHNQQSPLFPELNTFDFFILVQGRLSKEKESDLLKAIRSINGVLTAYFPETEKLKEFDNFLSDLELHMTALNTKN